MNEKIDKNWKKALECRCRCSDERGQANSWAGTVMEKPPKIAAKIAKCYRQTHWCTVAPMHRCTDAPLHRHTNAPTHQCTNAPMHRHIDRLTYIMGYWVWPYFKQAYPSRVRDSKDRRSDEEDIPSIWAEAVMQKTPKTQKRKIEEWATNEPTEGLMRWTNKRMDQ